MYFDFFSTAKYIASKNLVQGSSGNLSYLVEPGKLWITGSGAWLEETAYDNFVECAFPSGKILVSRSNNRPSSELGMHLAVLNKRKSMRAVLHFQAPYATVLSSSESNYANLDYLNTIPEIPYYIGKVGRVPYYLPGSKELIKAVSEEIVEHDAILLQNHGQLVVGKDLEDIIQKALFLEQASMIVVNVKGIKILNEKQCEELRDYKTKRNSGS